MKTACFGIFPWIRDKVLNGIDIFEERKIFHGERFAFFHFRGFQRVRKELNFCEDIEALFEISHIFLKLLSS